MGKDELRIAAGVAILAGSFVVIGPIAGPWNYLAAFALFVAGLATIFWPKIVPLFWKRMKADPQPSMLDPRTAADMQLKAFRERRRAAEKAAEDAAGTAIVVDLSGDQASKLLQIQHDGGTYILSVSSLNGTAIWLYGDHPTIASLAEDKFVKRGETVDMTALRPARGPIPMTINDHVFATTVDGKVIQLILQSVRDYNSGDDRDVARLCYQVSAPKEFSLTAM